MKAPEILNRLPGPGKPRLIVENQTVRDIINLIRYKHEKHTADYDRIADLFWTGSVYSTAKKLFDFCKQNIRYEVESEESQSVRSPAKILTVRKGDCKHYSTFIAGVLDALVRKGIDIDWYYRFASYNPFDDSPGHVFVIVKQGKKEIWIDPVLDRFDYHKPFQSAIDKKVTTKKLSGMDYNAIGKSQVYKNRMGLSAMSARDCINPKIKSVGATASQTGALIQKVAPSLAVVPVVGWIAAAGGELVGTFLNIFGSKYSTSTNVRWLTAKYQYYVLGDSSATSDNHVNEANTANAQKWFSYVLGVPIYDQLRYHALRGTSPVTGKSLNLSRDQRANNYLNSLSAQEKQQVTYDQALAATYPADQFKENGIDGNYPPGSWKNFTAAPSLLDASGQTAASTGSGLFASLGSNIWLMLAIVGAGLFLVMSPQKHHAKRA